MDGKLIPWTEANVHVMTHALHYGCVFEGTKGKNMTKLKTADENWPKYVQKAILDLQRYMESKGKRMLHAELDDGSHLFVHRHEKQS
jgi:branched-chain amino acid aminotransferase